MKKAVRLADIADKLNVSIVTVSKALSDQKGVSETMRKRIKELAYELGYQYPATSKQAMEHDTYNIGILVSDQYFGKYDTFYWKMYQELTTKGAHKDCFMILEMLSLQNEKQLVYPKMLAEEKVDGLIVMGRLSDRYLEMLHERCDVSIVFLDFYDNNKECDAIISDSYYGSYRLTNHLFELGHTRIAYVGSLLSTASITDRYFGYARSLMEHGLSVRKDWIIPDRSEEDYEVVGGHTLRLPEEMPTAFVCNCDLTAAEVIRLLEKNGYSVPKDISVVGFDNYIYPGLVKLGITTYEVDIREMTIRCLAMLLKKIKGENYRRGVDIVGGTVIYRESCGLVSNVVKDVSHGIQQE